MSKRIRNKNLIKYFQEKNKQAIKKAPYKQPETLTEKELKQADIADEFYFAAIRNFYNSIVPDDQKVPPDTEFYRLFRTLGISGFFLIDSFTNDILFSFLGIEIPFPLEYLLEVFFDFAAQPLDETNPLMSDYIMKLYFASFREKGYEPLQKKVLCLIQEAPTEEFLNRDEIEVSRHNSFFMQWAGPNAISILRSLKENFHVDSIKVKVINKVNNPKAYKDYLKLKRIMDKIDDLGIIGM